jgi:hypothetical protein
MKKVLLSLLFTLYVAGSLFSQTLSLADSTGPIANNATVTLAGTSTSDELVSYAFVKNNSATDTIPVKVKKVELHLTAGVVNTFCWGLCFAPTVYISTTTIDILPGRTDSIDFTGHVQPGGNSGYTLMRYVFFDERSPDDSVSFNVNYTHYPLAVNNSTGGLLLSQAYPNPASEKVSFDFNIPSGSGKIIIRNILGSVVREMDLGQATGKVQISTAELPDGIYFYTLNLSGKPQVTRKLVIKH